jgi:hypothetical protein
MAVTSRRGAGGDKKVEPLKFADVADAIVKAGTEIELEAARALIPRVETPTQQAELNAKASGAREGARQAGGQARQPPQAAAATDCGGVTPC